MHLQVPVCFIQMLCLSGVSQSVASEPPVSLHNAGPAPDLLELRRWDPRVTILASFL